MRTAIPETELLDELHLCVEFFEAYSVWLNINRVLSECRETDIVYQRALMSCYFRAKGFSYAQVGFMLNRDHASIMNLMKNYTRGALAAGLRQDFNKFRVLINATVQPNDIEKKIQYHYSEIARLQKILKDSPRSGIVC